MSTPYNPSRFLVGFQDWYLIDDFRKNGFASPEEMAHAALKRAPGFVAILERFYALNAVLVGVNPTQADQFATRARRFDEVEYCDNDYYLEACSFPALLHESHRKGDSQDRAMRPHLARYGTSASGLGTRVAMLDTGLAPHPYLPSLSFREAHLRPLTRHPSLRGAHTDAFMKSLYDAESLLPLAYQDPTEHQALRSSVASEVSRFVDAAWSSWESDLQAWIGQQRRPQAPTPPRLRGLLGALRVVSPESWNFVDGNPNVLDLDGHGTGMAGCLFALPPLATTILPTLSPALSTHPDPEFSAYPDHLKSLEFEVTGLAPYAELIVMRCLKHRSVTDDKSTLSVLVNALGRCLQLSVDCVYIGCAVVNQASKKLLALSRRTAQLATAGITVFAPTGNDGKAGLRIPAACPGVLPVSAADDFTAGKLARAAYSSYADVSDVEEVAFCAYGGSAKSAVQVLSTDFGFIYDRGTSIAGAVATAVFANEFGNHYRSATEQLYRAQVSKRGQVDAKAVKLAIQGWQAPVSDVAAIIATMRASAIPPSGALPDPELGYGFVRL